MAWGGPKQKKKKTAAPKRAARRRGPTTEREEVMMDGDFDDEEEDDDEYFAPPPGASVVTASVQQSGAGAASFIIPRKASIESDNKPHKLTIGVITLNPHFMHYTAPGLSPHAYLQTRTQNTSEYPFLPSSQVSVFFDGNFVTTSSMKHVSPGESFQSFLGVDPSVKVDYRPVRQTHSSSGMWSKTSSTQYDHRTVITNNKQIPIEIIIAKVFPRSTDEMIRISLISPTREEVDAEEHKHHFDQVSATDSEVINHLAEGEGGVNTIMHNKLTNNMVWARTIQPTKKQDVIFSYSIARPSDQQIDIVNN